MTTMTAMTAGLEAATRSTPRPAIIGDLVAAAAFVFGVALFRADTLGVAR